MDLGKLADDGCNDECSYDRKCIGRADWYAAYDLRKRFWGKPEEDPYMPQKRLHQIVDIYKYCDAVKVYFSFNLLLLFNLLLCNNVDLCHAYVIAR